MLNTTLMEESGHNTSLFPLFLPTDHRLMPSHSAGCAVTLSIV
jgi:hypothetical protein